MPLLPTLVGGLEFRERVPRYRGEPTYKRLDFVRTKNEKEDYQLVRAVYPSSSHRRSGSGGKQKVKAIEAPPAPPRLTPQQWQHVQQEQARQEQIRQQAFREHQQREQAMRQQQQMRQQQWQQQQQQQQQQQHQMHQMHQMGGHRHPGHPHMQGGHPGGMPPPPPMHPGPQVHPMQAGGHHPQMHQQHPQHPMMHQQHGRPQPQMGMNPPRMQIGNQQPATFADIVELHSDDESDGEAILHEIRPRRRGHSRPRSVVVLNADDIYDTSEDEEEDRHRSRSRRRMSGGYHQ